MSEAKNVLLETIRRIDSSVRGIETELAWIKSALSILRRFYDSFSLLVKEEAEQQR